MEKRKFSKFSLLHLQKTLEPATIWIFMLYLCSLQKEKAESKGHRQHEMSFLWLYGVACERFARCGRRDSPPTRMRAVQRAFQHLRTRREIAIDNCQTRFAARTI